MSDRLLEDDEESSLIDPPITKKLGVPVVVLEGVKKYYHLPGNEDAVKALDGITLARDSEFYPIRRGEFVMLR